MKTTVMTFGTFDHFHQGHKYFLAESKKHGDYLITVIARDKTVHKVKNQTAQNNEIDRKNKVKSSKIADKVVLGYIRNKYKVIEKFKPDVICLGYDQFEFTEHLKKVLSDLHLKTKIVRIESHYPDKYKSSYFRTK
jgi:choline-phosphate cytidylyltransferase